MKKIIMCFALFCAVLQVTAYAKTDDFEGNCKKLGALGIISEDSLSREETVSRAAFTDFMVKISGCDRSLSADTLPFTDVTSADEGYDSISAAYRNGFIKSAEKFNPQRSITYLEAVIIAQRVLGYDKLAEISGADTQYLRYAKEADIDINCASGKEITGIEAAELLLNTLHAYPLIYSGEENGLSYRQADENILKINFDIEYIEGIVTANEITDLYSSESDVGENFVRINDEVYDVGESNAFDFLGISSQVYYESSTSEIICIVADSRYSSITRVNYKDVSSADKSVIKYEIGGKQKKLKIDSTAKLIYNGKFTALSNATIGSECGDYVLIDNDGDNSVDVVKLTEYEIFRIEGISREDKTVTAKDGRIFILDSDDKDTRIIFTKNNETSDFEMLSCGDVVMYAESENTGVMLKTVFASNETVSGTISELGEKAVINSAEYKISSGASEVLSCGITGTFFLNAYGEIFDFDLEIRNVFGYVRRMFKDTDSDSFCLRIFTEKGRWVTLSLNDSLEYCYGGRRTASEAALAMGGASYTFSGLIEYKVNADGKIIMLNLPSVFEPYSEAEKVAIKDDKFRLLDSGSYDFNLDAVVLGETVGLTGSTVMFSVPSDSGSSKESDYEIISVSLLADAKEYTFAAYNGNESRLCEVCVIYDIPSFVNVGGQLSGLIIFDELTDICIDDEVKRAVRGYMSGSEIVLVLSDDDAIIASAESLEQGDIIQTSFDRAGGINGIEVVYNHSDTEVIYGASNSFASKFTFVMGEVAAFDRQESRLLIKYSSNGYGITSLSGLQSVYLYDMSERPHIKTVDVADITVGDTVFCGMKYGRTREAIIYRQ